ncbi:MAG: TonB family protein [Pseudomonadota bacterium]
MAVERFKTQVLILHPHQAVLDACRKVFAEADYTLHFAQSGREALATLGETPIDYFVTAEDLPGMTGSETLREARRRSPEIQGILIAGRDSSEEDIAALASSRDFVAVLKSSASPRELFNLVVSSAGQRGLNALSESANDATHAPDTSSTGRFKPIAPSDEETPLFVVDDEAELTGAHEALSKPSAITAAQQNKIVEILVLTGDEAFYQGISQAARGKFSVHRCPTLQSASDIVATGRVGVLVTDAAVAPSEVKSITEQLRRVQPALVTIVAGRRDDGDELMGLISEGIVYRFLLKPVSPGRTRLALDASAKKAREYRDNPPPPPAPTRRSAATTMSAVRSSIIDLALDDDSPGQARLIAVAAALLIAVGAGLYWWGSRDNGSAVATEPVTEASETSASEPAASELATPSPVASAPTVPPKAASTSPSSVFELRRAAFRALAEGRIAAPAGDNALSLYAEAMSINPLAEGLEDEFNAAVAEALSVTEGAITRGALNEAQATLARLREVRPLEPRLPFLESQLRKERVSRLLANAASTAAAGDTAAAVALVDRAAVLAPGDPAITTARQQIRAAEDSRAIAELVTLGQQRLEAGALTAPAGDSAAFYFRAVLAQEPDNPIARQSLELIGRTLLTDAERALQQGDVDRAQQLTRTARDNGAPASALAAIEATIAARSTPPADEAVERAAASVPEPTRRGAQSPASSAPPGVERGTESAATAAPVADSATTAPVDLPPLVRSKYVAPIFPRNAARRAQDGFVHLAFTVTPAGAVTNITVLESEPGTVFVNAARRALAGWEFEPTVVAGEAISREGDVRINFSLTD